ncbi:M23 family metallopeptidase [Pseudomonas sp. EA_65y_Pfl1_P120]|uniref:M23 family metallopeptidase n=1 Tax=Pseudomonas sp. EA_65y_Pfl1_P120 TaxID=3088693 RepID=UPI0030DD4C3B
MELYNPGSPFRYTSAWNLTRTHPVTGVVRPHRGGDWGAPSGTPIPAAGAGKVVYKANMTGYGNVVVLEHANGVEIVHTLYAHMSAQSPLVIGASVAKGATVGPCGNTGIGTGPHLHFEVLRNGTRGQPNLAKGHATVNPRGFDISHLVHPDGAQTAAAPKKLVEAVNDGEPWQFPIRKADGKQFSKIEEIYKAMEAETSGHYLLGGHDFWHGGMHISDKSAPHCVRDEPIRCVGDGVVVAYRLNKHHLVSEYIGLDTCTALKYSTSFCLVRHEYESPINKESKGDKSNKLVFFSLYMHILPYDDYNNDSGEPARRLKVVNGGWPARDHHMDDAKSNVVGTIPAGVEFEILQEKPTADGKYLFAQGRVLKGSFSGAKEKDVVWFAIQEQGVPIKNNMGKERLAEVIPPVRAIPSYWKGIVEASVSVLQGLKVRGAPNGDKAGAQVAPGQVLCTGSVIRFDSNKIRWLLLEDGKKYPMAECTLVPSENSGLKGAGTLPEKFWCCVDDVGAKRMVTRKDIIPVDFESVVMTNTAIRAGEPIGYMGLYEVPANENGGAQSKHQVHVEIFSSDTGLESFLKNPAGLVEGKKFLVLKKGQMLAAKSEVDKTLIFTEQEPSLLAKSYSVMDSSSVIKDANGNEWLKVSILDSEKPQEGYVNKKNVEVICQHDWEKLGYSVLKESNSDADGFLDPKGMPAFFQDVYSKIDAKGTEDGIVTSAELQAALRDPSIRSTWSKFIAYHPTEWQAKSSEPKWGRLKVLLKDCPELLKHEQERIDNLVFWDELSGAMQVALPKSVYHFHPLGFVSNIRAKVSAGHTGLFTVADGKAAIKIIYEKYGKEMAIIIERMYRDETAHFESGQYAHCGTGGMEAFGRAPYYGWDGTFFEAHPEHAPVGTWSAFENKGMSGQGGNIQVKDKKKVFVVLPSVLAGMEYKVAYITKWGGNWARWHSTKIGAQTAYKTHIQAIRARFVEALEKEI